MNEYKTKKKDDPEFKRKQRQYQRKWREVHRDRQLEMQRAYREKNREHYNELSKLRKREERARDPEKHREANRRWQKKLFADPERRQAFLEKKRMDYHLKKEREGRLLDDGRRKKMKLTEDIPRVDPAPFLKWVRLAMLERGFEKMKQFADAIDEDDSYLYKVRDGKIATVPINIVDRYLTKHGGPSLKSLYPEA